MISHKITVIMILIIPLANGACPRPQANYCSDVDDHNCLDRPGASMPDAAASPHPMDASPDMNSGCNSNTECSSTTPICGIDHKCRICIASSECPDNACSPEGRCIQEDNVAYVIQGGDNAPDTPCTQEAPCGSLQLGLSVNQNRDNRLLPYVRVSGSFITTDSIKITKNITILGDASSQLIYKASPNNPDNTQKPALMIQFDSGNDKIIINNFGITVLAGTDSIRILGNNPIVNLTHVSLDDGEDNSGTGRANGHGIDSSVATNPNITLTDVVIRRKINGIQTKGGQLIITQSSILSNRSYGIAITGTDDTTSNKFKISQSSILHNGMEGIFCSPAQLEVTTSPDVMISNNTSNDTSSQVRDCKLIPPSDDM